MANKSMQFLWEGSDYLGERARLFANIFTNHFNPPKGFNYDENIRKNPLLTQLNETQKEEKVLLVFSA